MRQSEWSPNGYRFYYRKADGGISFSVERLSDGKTVATASNDARELVIKFDKRTCKEPEHLTGYLNSHLAAYWDNRL